MALQQRHFYSEEIMESKNQLRLPDKFIELLENLPEHGMGYHLVEIVLNDGRLLHDRIVFNSTYLKLHLEDDFTNDEIKAINIKNK